MAKQKVAQGSTADSDSIRTADENRTPWRAVVGWLDVIRDEDERWCIEYRFDDDSVYVAPIVEELPLAPIADDQRKAILENVCEQVAFLSEDGSNWIVMVFIGLEPSFARASNELAAVIERVYQAERAEALTGEEQAEIESPLAGRTTASRASGLAADGAVSA